MRTTLARLCESRRTRSILFTKAAPTRWEATRLRHPLRPGEMFTDDAAWEFVRLALQSDAPVETVELRHPPGKTAYVLKLAGHPPVAVIYVKLQVVGGKVIGRSFHESTPGSERVEA